mmetsp:Transcript_18566/g.46511  ORF Transcript_18566/g.46511 Transcript_18566/m.46511 type:complete len:225 (-) Transcript_18566:616-1290(-)
MATCHHENTAVKEVAHPALRRDAAAALARCRLPPLHHRLAAALRGGVQPHESRVRRQQHAAAHAAQHQDHCSVCRRQPYRHLALAGAVHRDARPTGPPSGQGIRHRGGEEEEHHERGDEEHHHAAEDKADGDHAEGEAVDNGDEPRACRRLALLLPIRLLGDGLGVYCPAGRGGRRRLGAAARRFLAGGGVAGGGGARVAQRGVPALEGGCHQVVRDPEEEGVE